MDLLIAQTSGAVLINTIVKGLAMGGVYAIIALGFVIIFKATQVVNFAQGALAAMGRALRVVHGVRPGNSK